MKKVVIILFSIVLGLFIVFLIKNVVNAVQMGGGTLGAIERVELNCSEPAAKKQLETILLNNSFRVSDNDSTIIEWWRDNGYGFLNYVCINIQGTLYMVSLNSESSIESQLSIRSYYNRNKKGWLFVTDFSDSEYNKAKKAQEYLLKYMKSCN